jgi:hypothetical protein
MKVALLILVLVMPRSGISKIGTRVMGFVRFWQMVKNGMGCCKKKTEFSFISSKSGQPSKTRALHKD